MTKSCRTENKLPEYRKTQTIEVIDAHFICEAGNGVKVQNAGNPKDQWVIPTAIFNKTYEPVKAADYKVLTLEERKEIRNKLTILLDLLIKREPNMAASNFISYQAILGEEMKTFDGKIEALDGWIIGYKQMK